MHIDKEAFGYACAGELRRGQGEKAGLISETATIEHRSTMKCSDEGEWVRKWEKGKNSQNSPQSGGGLNMGKQGQSISRAGPGDRAREHVISRSSEGYRLGDTGIDGQNTAAKNGRHRKNYSLVGRLGARGNKPKLSILDEKAMPGAREKAYDVGKKHAWRTVQALGIQD